MERSTIFHGKTHYKWPCSIAMLVYQRVKTSKKQLGAGKARAGAKKCRGVHD
jgi:hypothetical protein